MANIYISLNIKGCDILSFWLGLKETIEVIYYISGAFVAVGVLAAFKQIRVVKKDLKDRNRRAAVESSLKYLSFYASVIIPAISKYKDKFRSEVPIPTDSDHLFNGNFNFTDEILSKELMAEVIIKQELELVHILNQMEFFSVAILNNTADEDIVYTPVSKNFCKFVRKEHVLISLSRNHGAPYKNLIELYNKWSDRIEVEKLKLQKQEVEHKIKQKGDGYKSNPPIGMEG